jgi:hypothetical protein
MSLTLEATDISQVQISNVIAAVWMQSWPNVFIVSPYFEVTVIDCSTDTYDSFNWLDGTSDREVEWIINLTDQDEEQLTFTIGDN